MQKGLILFPVQLLQNFRQHVYQATHKNKRPASITVLMGDPMFFEERVKILSSMCASISEYDDPIIQCAH